MTPMISQTAVILLSILGLALLSYLLYRLIRLYLKYRGARIVECPETKAPAAVELNAMRALATGGKPSAFQLKDCSRWPEHQSCGQECLSQIESSPESCLLRTIIAHWYSDKSCTVCAMPIGVVDWMHHKPALLSPDRLSIDWNTVAPEEVPELLKTHKPICWNCHVATTFRHSHPELVIDRPWRK